MGFGDFLYTLIKYGLLLAVLAAIALAGLFLANQHVRAQRKQKAQEKAKFRQSLKAPEPTAQRPTQVLVSASSPSRQPTTPQQQPTHRANASIDSSARQTPTGKPSHRASMLIQNTKAVFSTLTQHKDEDAKPLSSQIKKGMRKRLASFKVKQAPKIKEQMSNLGFETSFNPLFEAGFARIEDMVLEDPDIEVEQQLAAGGSRKFGTMKRQSKAMAAPVLAGAYAMDSLPSKTQQEAMQEGTTNPAFGGAEDDGEEEVIWLEGEIAGKRCWEDIDTGVVVEVRPTEGTITNQTTLDTMMSEGTDAQGNIKFSSTYEEMRKSFKVSTPSDGVSRKSSGQVHYVDYEDDDDDDSGQEDLEEIRQLDHTQNNAMMQMLGS